MSNNYITKLGDIPDKKGERVVKFDRIFVKEDKIVLTRAEGVKSHSKIIDVFYGCSFTSK